MKVLYLLRFFILVSPVAFCGGPVSKQFRTEKCRIAGDMAVGDLLVLKRKVHNPLLAEHVPDLGVCAWVKHLAALLTPQTGGVPVMAHGLAPLSKVDWLPALATSPHPA